MKAKLQEWREQQKQQKQQQQQQKVAQRSAAGSGLARHAVDTAKKAPLHQTRTAAPATTNRLPSAEPASHTVNRQSAVVKKQSLVVRHSSHENLPANLLSASLEASHDIATPSGDPLHPRPSVTPAAAVRPFDDALGKEAGNHASEEGVVQIKAAKAKSGANKAGKQARNKGPSIEELNLELQCKRWRHLQWRFLNCRLEEAMAVAKPKAEQGLAAVALHVADLHKQVTQQQYELRAVERQRRVEAALASQMPRLQRWQSTQADQQKSISAVQSALSHALQHVPLLNGATTGGPGQGADASLVAGEVAKLRDALRQSQQHVDSLMGQAAGAASTQVPAIMAQGSDGSTEAAGNMGRTARMVTKLAETSHELKQYLGANNAMLENYSHELLHVQSLAAQLVQMSSMQQLSSHEIL
ncbi:hypothetical protein WJX82_004464 [Trebouxia sp. C0006]